MIRPKFSRFSVTQIYRSVRRRRKKNPARQTTPGTKRQMVHLDKVKKCRVSSSTAPRQEVEAEIIPTLAEPRKFEDPETTGIPRMDIEADPAGDLKRQESPQIYPRKSRSDARN